MSVAERVRRRLNEGFVYTADLTEDWRSRIEALRAHREWRDDCDGYAITASQCAIEDIGVDPVLVLWVFCRTETGDGHLVCLIEEDGTALAVDNRQRAAWEWSRLPYKWISAMRLSDPGVWREIINDG